MKLRVCILAEAEPFTWVTHYIAAFRERCDVITIGPTFDISLLDDWGCPHLADLVKPNDIEMDLDKIDDLYAVLPEDWEPHLVIAIASGGMTAFRNTTRLMCPTVFITVDTWQCLPNYLDALHYDFVFEAQREYVPYLEATGSRHVFWLPLACNPSIHHPVNVENDHDIAFVGATKAVVHGIRAQLLEELKQHFNVLHEKDIHGEEISEIFCRGKIAFNCSAVQDLNMRVFEAMAMGCVLLTNRDSDSNGLLEFFEDGKHLVTYDSAEDLLNKARKWLSNDAGRKNISETAHKEVLSRHTYAHRVDKIIEMIERYVPDLKTYISRRKRLESTLAHYISNGSSTVVDIGLSSELTKHAVHQLGVKNLIGLVQSEADAGTRRHAYDDVVTCNSEKLQADTVILANPAKITCSLDDAIKCVHTILNCGGTLILCMNNEVMKREKLQSDNDHLTEWLRKKDFVLTYGRFTGVVQENTGVEGCLLVARKRIRSVTDIAQEIITRHPIIGEAVYSQDYLSKLPFGI